MTPDGSIPPVTPPTPCQGGQHLPPIVRGVQVAGGIFLMENLQVYLMPDRNIMNHTPARMIATNSDIFSCREAKYPPSPPMTLSEAM